MEYAYCHRDEYQAILWARADSRETLVLDYIALASQLHLPEKDAQDQTITIEAISRWLDTHDQWLLILDNADDISMLDNFLPTTTKGYILLTTRAHTQGSLAYNIEVRQIEPTIGALFLLRRAYVLMPDQACETDYAAALDLTLPYQESDFAFFCIASPGI